MFNPNTAALDAEATREAIVALLPQMRAFARSLTRNLAQGDDLVQDALLKALGHIDSFEPGTNLRAWMFTILRNTFYSDLRKRRREVEDVDGKYAGLLMDAPRQDVNVDLEDFKQVFAKLRADHREVLTLVGGSGCSYEEAAVICGCAVGTIKSRMSRARRALSELMGVADEHWLENGRAFLPQHAIASR